MYIFAKDLHKVAKRTNNGMDIFVVTPSILITRPWMADGSNVAFNHGNTPKCGTESISVLDQNQSSKSSK